MEYKCIDHIAIGVKDREEAKGIYEDSLGFTFDRYGVSEAMGIKQAFFALGDGRHLAMIEPLGPETPVGRAIASRGEGFYVASIEIDSLADAISTLEPRGVRLLNTQAERGPIFVHPRNAHGMLIQLTQRGPDFHHEPNDSQYAFFDHMVLAVRDRDEAIATYRDVLGFQFDRTAVSEPLGIKQAFFRFSDGRVLELAEPLGPETPVGRALERRGEGLYLIALAVRDRAATVAELQSKGIQLIGADQPDGQVFIHPRSTKGVLYQLVERG